GNLQVDVVILQVLPEEAERDHAGGLEIVLEAQIVVARLPRTEVDIGRRDRVGGVVGVIDADDVTPVRPRIRGAVGSVEDQVFGERVARVDAGEIIVVVRRAPFPGRPLRERARRLAVATGLFARDGRALQADAGENVEVTELRRALDIGGSDALPDFPAIL